MGEPALLAELGRVPLFLLLAGAATASNQVKGTP
jgi:hypothetical protein